MRREAFLLFAVALAGSAQAAFGPALAGPHDALIAKHAAANGVPEHLVRRVIRVESGGNAAAVHAGNYGLMQIRLATARSIGYPGDAAGLLDPDTNLTYAVKYLAGAYRAAGCDADRAMSLYMRGYYGAPKRACAEPPTETAQVAQAQTRTDDKPVRAVAPAKSKSDAAGPGDVIKPKLVRTETIATPNSAASSPPPTGKFEPSRATPPPVRPAEVAVPLPVRQPERPADTVVATPSTTPAPTPAGTSKTDKLAPAAPQFDLASVPLPPARRELEPPPKPEVQPARRAKRERSHERSTVRAPERTENKAAFASIGDPAAVVTFLKKLVTPDKKSRKWTMEAEADPASQVQAPR